MEAELKKFQTLPPPSVCRLIDFTHADVRPGFVTNTFILTVSGDKPWLTMTVELYPLIYIHQPEYWGFEVVGCMSGIGLPVVIPYHVSIDISHHRGTKGIEVIGAHSRKQINVP
ncbi:MAG TPA: hypothetical protein VK734_01585 [Bradyrhizobium sp.]|jgi:hypothetical protein|nr:hypothetical protein [Bradyrhizobium sp.]